MRFRLVETGCSHLRFDAADGSKIIVTTVAELLEPVRESDTPSIAILKHLASNTLSRTKAEIRTAIEAREF